MISKFWQVVKLCHNLVNSIYLGLTQSSQGMVPFAPFPPKGTRRSGAIPLLTYFV